MNIDTLIEYVVIKKTQVLLYGEKIEIIEQILELQETFPELDESPIMSALGLQTLTDIDLIIIYHDTLFLHAAQFFIEISK